MFCFVFVFVLFLFLGGGVVLLLLLLLPFSIKPLKKKGIAVFFPTLKTKRNQLSLNSQPNSPTNIDNAKS